MVTQQSVVEVWRDRVADAAETSDREALRMLYAQAQELFGDRAAHEWAEVLSPFDASAQTG